MRLSTAPSPLADDLDCTSMRAAYLLCVFALVAGCTTVVDPDGVVQVPPSSHFDPSDGQVKLDPPAYRVRAATAGVPVNGPASSEARSKATAYCKAKGQQMSVKSLTESNASSFIPGREAELIFTCVKKD